MLNVFVSVILCILQYIFLLNVAKYAFIFLSSYINLWGIIPSLTQAVGRGRGKLALCGHNGEMWTQVGEMMNGEEMNRKGVIDAHKRVVPRNQNHDFP